MDLIDMPTTDAPSGPRGEYAGTPERRREIVETAIEVFSERGYHGGSLRDVAQRVGLTHAGLRHHFPTKLDLLRAVLVRRDEHALELVATTHPTGIHLLREWVAALRRSPGTPELVNLQITLTAEATSPDHPAREYFRQRYRMVSDLLANAFSVLRDEGLLDPDTDPRTAAEVVVGASEGLQLMWFYDRSIDVAEKVACCVGSLLTKPGREQLRSALAPAGPAPS